MSNTMDWQIKRTCANSLAFIRRHGQNIFINYGGRNERNIVFNTNGYNNVYIGKKWF